MSHSVYRLPCSQLLDLKPAVKFTGYIQDNSGGKVNILGGDSIGHCEKKVHMNL
jgi:hypothetical protein